MAFLHSDWLYFLWHGIILLQIGLLAEMLRVLLFLVLVRKPYWVFTHLFKKLSDMVMDGELNIFLVC